MRINQCARASSCHTDCSIRTPPRPARVVLLGRSWRYLAVPSGTTLEEGHRGERQRRGRERNGNGKRSARGATEEQQRNSREMTQERQRIGTGATEEGSHAARWTHWVLTSGLASQPCSWLDLRPRSRPFPVPPAHALCKLMFRLPSSFLVRFPSLLLVRFS